LPVPKVGGLIGYGNKSEHLCRPNPRGCQSQPADQPVAQSTKVGPPRIFTGSTSA